MTENMEQQNELQNFLKQNITPLLKEENKYRQKIIGKIWLYFGILFFVNSANVLIVLFHHLVNDRPLSWEQLIFIAVVSALFLIFYTKHVTKKHDFHILRDFFKYYGEWHTEYERTAVLNGDFLPPHDEVLQNFTVTDENEKIKLQDIVLYSGTDKKKSKAGAGLLLSGYLTQPISGKLNLFEKGGFFKQKKYNDLEKTPSSVPASNYFLTFAENSSVKNYVVCAALFENLLDLRDTFHASKIYFQLDGNKLDIFLQNGALAYHESSIWHSAGEEKQFEQVDKQLEKIFNIIDILETLTEMAVGHD